MGSKTQNSPQSFRELETVSLHKHLIELCLTKSLKFLTQNNLLDSNQSGFRIGHSTETPLLSVVEALKLARADSNLFVFYLFVFFLFIIQLTKAKMASIGVFSLRGTTQLGMARNGTARLGSAQFAVPL